MSILVGRHGLSEANNRHNIGTLAFGAEQAPLMDIGVDQANAMGAEFVSEYGLVLNTTVVATSELLRTQQTAKEAGFVAIRSYGVLNEVKHGMDIYALKAMLDAGKLPRIAIQAAEITLANPPEEDVWISHGLRIAGLSAVLGVYQKAKLVPRFCEIRELPIDR